MSCLLPGVFTFVEDVAAELGIPISDIQLANALDERYNKVSPTNTYKTIPSQTCDKSIVLFFHSCYPLEIH